MTKPTVLPWKWVVELESQKTLRNGDTRVLEGLSTVNIGVAEDDGDRAGNGEED